jgi:uncharacterized SAM-binding protein YcdF (DUF218 family)
MIRFFVRRDVWCPTKLGAAVLLSALALPCLWWFNYGERFLAPTNRIANARILVVEGWIGPEGLRAAKAEFDTHNYDLIVTSGGNPDPRSEDNWQRAGWSYAEGAQKQLLRLGVPAGKVVSAPPKETEARRTYRSALMVKETLDSLDGQPKSINVFTLGPHARRSWLVFQKACGPETSVGIIGWEPPVYNAKSWWHSSERAIDLLVQTVGFFFEYLFNSGRH